MKKKQKNSNELLAIIFGLGAIAISLINESISYFSEDSLIPPFALGIIFLILAIIALIFIYKLVKKL